MGTLKSKETKEEAQAQGPPLAWLPRRGKLPSENAKKHQCCCVKYMMALSRQLPWLAPSVEASS